MSESISPARRFGGLSAGPMPAVDREWIEQETRRRCLARLTLADRVEDGTTTDSQIAESAALAVDLYETAASYGISKAAADAVTSFIDVAIDAIRARDRSLT